MLNGLLVPFSQRELITGQLSLKEISAFLKPTSWHLRSPSILPSAAGQALRYAAAEPVLSTVEGRQLLRTGVAGVRLLIIGKS